MIDATLLGRPLRDLSRDAFHHGFDDPDLLDQRCPSLVLASLDVIPLNASNWFLAAQDCGGFRCNVKPAAILPLPIRATILKSLQGITDESFAGEGGLDYFESENHMDRQFIVQQYVNLLESLCLTCSKDLIGELTQALYPVDATYENLRVLTDAEIDLESLDDNCRIAIFIVGENCD